MYISVVKVWFWQILLAAYLFWGMLILNFLYFFQLINKFDDLHFTKNDENFVEAFAIFCGMGIHNTHM